MVIEAMTLLLRHSPMMRPGRLPATPPGSSADGPSEQRPGGGSGGARRDESGTVRSARE
jgi:hypothetical protein